MVKIQECGGYEGTIRCVDVEKIARMREVWVPATGRRKVGELKPEDAARSARRARRKVRWLCKWLGADRMLTFTSRELLPTPDAALKAWRRFTRLYRKAVQDDKWAYVAVVERHESGFYHLHVAVSGFFVLKIAHRFWQIALGGNGGEKGAACRGTIDIDKRARGKAPAWRIARYIGKYMTKDSDVGQINRKRYWASRSDLPQVRRLWLEADTLEGAITEAWRKLDVGTASQMFLAEDGGVFWWYVAPGEGGRDPPF